MKPVSTSSIVDYSTQGNLNQVAPPANNVYSQNNFTIAIQNTNNYLIPDGTDKCTHDLQDKTFHKEWHGMYPLPNTPLPCISGFVLRLSSMFEPTTTATASPMLGGVATNSADEEQPDRLIGPCSFYVLHMEVVVRYIAYAVCITGSIGECSESTL